MFLAALLSTASDVVDTVGKHFAQPIKARDSKGNIKITVVKGTKSVSYQEYEEIKEIYNFSHISYIDPTGLFQGQVIKNENGIISEVRFEQK